MLKSLAIRNFAIIDAIEVELRAGLNVFTGETGAGKSIVVEALGLTLGDRADAAMVRSGAERAEVTAVFDIADNPAVLALLAERGLDAGTECILRRQLLADGGSRAFCNGTPVTVQSLREYAAGLVDIHGQNAHQSLQHRAHQRELLDEFAGTRALLDDVAAGHRQWHGIDAALRGLATGGSDRDAEADLLRYQLAELAGTVPDAATLADTEQRHRRLTHAAHLVETCAQVSEVLSGDEGGMLRRLARLKSDLGGLVRYAPELKLIGELIDGAAIQLDDATRGLRDLQESLDRDPGELETIEQQLRAWHDLARKHRVDMSALPERLAALRDRLAGFERDAGRVHALQAERDSALTRYRATAAALSEARHTAAPRMSREITGHMHELGMPGGRFELVVTTAADDSPAAHGYDTVEFTVSANPGQDLRPLSRVASGGELSRISLGIQVAAAARTGVPVLVYDEVDAGIGGAVAQIVGQRLAQLAAHRQVLCVTHLPQVASHGHHHFVVGKEVSGNSTRTAVTHLPREQRVVEIARMLGGVEITSKTIAHARELLARTS